MCTIFLFLLKTTNTWPYNCRAQSWRTFWGETRTPMNLIYFFNSVFLIQAMWIKFMKIKFSSLNWFFPSTKNVKFPSKMCQKLRYWCIVYFVYAWIHMVNLFILMIWVAYSFYTIPNYINNKINKKNRPIWITLSVHQLYYY